MMKEYSLENLGWLTHKLLCHGKMMLFGIMSNSNINTDTDLCYKKCGNYIVKMKKLPDTRTNETRTGVIDRKHAKFRADKLFVVSIEHETTGEKIDEIENTFYEEKVCYIVSQEVSVEDYDPDLNRVCTTGIHYFLSRESAFYWNIAKVKDGQYYKWYENGQKNEECTYRDGVKHGPYHSWYENSQKEEECTYINSEKHGLYRSWYKNGKKMEECTLNNGVIDGKYYRWLKSGQKVEECTYQYGIRDGQYYRWLRNGLKVKDYTYKNGIKHGSYYNWYEWSNNGRLHIPEWC